MVGISSEQASACDVTTSLVYQGPASTNEMLLYVFVFNAWPIEPIRATDISQ
jgi:hypothetical protein